MIVVLNISNIILEKKWKNYITVIFKIIWGKCEKTFLEKFCRNLIVIFTYVRNM